MTFVEMTSEEWEEVRRHHDELVQMGELEMQAEEIRETPRADAASQHVAKPVELQLRELDDVMVSIQH